MSNKLIRFASVALLALVAACHSTPRKPAAQQPSVAAAAAASSSNPPATGKASARGKGAEAQGAKAPPPEAPVPVRAAQEYARALSLMKAGKSTDAELEFKQLADAYPEFAGPEVNLGLLYLKESQYQLAEGAFKEALQRNPNSVVANDELGIAERKLGKFAEAEAAYQRTITLEPNYAPAYLNLGVLYDLYMAQPQKALEQFQHYLDLAGENKQVAGWVIELKKRVGAPPPAKKEEPA